MAVSIEVSCGKCKWAPSCAERRSQRESTIAVAKQDAHSAGSSAAHVGDRYIEYSVAIEIPNGYPVRTASHCRCGFRRERASPVAQKNGNGVVGFVGDRQIQFPVRIKIRRHQTLWIVPHRYGGRRR